MPFRLPNTCACDMRARHKASEAGKKAAPDRVSQRHIRAGMFTAMLATLTKTDDENTAASNSVFIFETWLQQLRRASSIFLG